ncbi:MAG: apolipoprotein N-acyltransferase [Rickettsiales bacterium]|jgi:apolipoprotein N-acyltransferase|nr:apolipoprotein N-acyltransferase [Rickettsiales bacterium]
MISFICDSPSWNGAISGIFGKSERAAEAVFEVLRRRAPAGAEISVLLTDDAGIRRLNKKWRAVDKATNVLSFETGDKTMMGDIAMSIDTLSREAEENGKSLEEHYTHLLVHGVLHLLGYDHAEDGEAAKMERLEVMVLKRLGIGNPYKLDWDFVVKEAKRKLGIAAMYVFFGIAGGFAYTAAGSLWGVLGMSAFLSSALMFVDTSRSRRAAFLNVWGLTFISYLIAFSWIMHPFNFVPEGAEHMKMFAPAALLLFAASLAVFSGVAGIAAHMAPSGWRRYLAFAASLALMEWVRGRAFTGLPWNTFSSVWSGEPIVMQTLSLVGTHGLSFLSVFVLAAPYLFLRHGKAAFKMRTLHAAFAMSAAVFVFGAARLLYYSGEKPRDFMVRLVNLDVAQNEKLAGGNLFSLMRLSHAPGWQDVDLFVWSETSVPANVASDEYAQKLLSDVNNARSHLAAGFNRFDVKGDDFDVYNSMAVIGGEGVEAVYDKNHLVPFGEYMPLRRLLPFKKFTAGMKDFSRGAARPLLGVGGLKAFPLICYEIIFPGLRVPAEADFILNISNDAWFAWSGRVQHMEIARFRAVEEGVPVVRVANSGISAVIGPTGLSVRAAAASGLSERGAIDAYLPARAGRTLFSYTGNWLFVLAMALILLLAFMRRPQR